MTEQLTIERIPTGIAALDAVLCGGFPTNSITIVAGEPGSGKTVLMLQLLFAAARAGKRCMYFTTLSEPAMKLLRFMQLFTFFDERLLDDKITFADLGSSLRRKGAEAALRQLVERVEETRPDIVVVDSFKAIHDMVEIPRQRSFVYDLAVTMAGWGTTTMLVGEYTESEMLMVPEFAIADGIVQLAAVREELARLRVFEVRKLRGSDFTTGTHFFDISSNGIVFYPRVRGPESVDVSFSLADRVATGVDGLDMLLRGGLPRASGTLVIGGTGTGKTILGLTFLVEGARRGEPGVLLALEETPEQLRDTAHTFGWDLRALEEQHLLAIFYRSPVELSTDRFLQEARQVIEAIGAKRVVVDSLTSMDLGTPSERRFKELVYALTKHLRVAGITSLMSMEATELFGMAQISGHGISFVADNIIFMRYLERLGRLDRVLTIIKARGIAHCTELVEVVIDEKGFRIGGQVKNQEGVLTGQGQMRAGG